MGEDFRLACAAMYLLIRTEALVTRGSIAYWCKDYKAAGGCCVVGGCGATGAAEGVSS
jgi:hypothetical protein